MATLIGTVSQKPDEVLDYDFDYTSFMLDRSDTIQSFTITPDAGLTVVSSVTTGYVVRAFITGGVAGATYNLLCSLVTTGGRTKDAYIKVRVVAA